MNCLCQKHQWNFKYGMKDMRYKAVECKFMTQRELQQQLMSG